MRERGSRKKEEDEKGSERKRSEVRLREECNHGRGDVYVCD